MSLTSKQSKELEIMLADKKAAAEMEAAMASDGTLSARTKAVLDIAMASKKRGDDVAAQIAASAGSVSAENEKVLDVAAASKATGDALESEIES
jgi:hypothetical protein